MKKNIMLIITILIFTFSLFVIGCNKDDSPSTNEIKSIPKFIVMKPYKGMPKYKMKNDMNQPSFKTSADGSTEPSNSFISFGTGYMPLFTGIKNNDSNEEIKSGNTYSDYGYYMGYPVSIEVKNISNGKYEFKYILKDLPKDIDVDFDAKTTIDTINMTWKYHHKYTGKYKGEYRIDNSVYDESGELKDGEKNNYEAKVWEDEFSEEMNGEGTFDEDGGFDGTGNVEYCSATYEDGKEMWSYSDSAKLKWNQDSDEVKVKVYDFKHEEKNNAEQNEITDIGFYGFIYNKMNIEMVYDFNKKLYKEEHKSEYKYSAPKYEAHNNYWYCEDGTYTTTASTKNSNESSNENQKTEIVTYKSIQYNYSEINEDGSGFVKYRIIDYYWDKEKQEWILVNKIEETYKLNAWEDNVDWDGETPEEPVWDESGARISDEDSNNSSNNNNEDPTGHDKNVAYGTPDDNSNSNENNDDGDDQDYWEEMFDADGTDSNGSKQENKDDWNK